MTELTLRITTETLFGSDESGSAQVVGDALRLMMNEFPSMLTPLGALRQTTSAAEHASLLARTSDARRHYLRTHRATPP